MKRLSRTLRIVLPLAILLLILRLTGVLRGSLATAVVGLEIALWLAAGVAAVTGFRRFRQERDSGLDRWAAFEEGLAVVLPRGAAHLIALEPKLYYALARWLIRRRPRDSSMYTYHDRSMLGVVVLLVLFVTPFEAIIPILLVPWGWLRWLLLALDLYVLIWLGGLYASLLVFPHRLESRGVRLHFGAVAGGYVPYDQIRTVTREQRSTGGRDGLEVAGDAALLKVGGQTDVRIDLLAPRRLQGFRGQSRPVREIHIAADRPADFVQALATRLIREDESPGA